MLSLLRKVYSHFRHTLPLTSKHAGAWCAAAAVGALMLGGQSARGQIYWGQATTISGNSDVLNVGVSSYAYAGATGSSSYLVNGVTFLSSTSTTSVDGGSITFSGINTHNVNSFTSTSNPFASLPTTYKAMLVGADYASTATTVTVNLNSLSTGHVYATQFWVEDPRGGSEANRVDTLTSGSSSVTLNFDSTHVTGGTGQYAIGGFTATGATQSFTVLGNAVSQINALQVRDVTGVWNGFTSSTLNGADGNYTAQSGSGGAAGNSYNAISSLAAPITALYFADTDGFGNSLTNTSYGYNNPAPSNLTVAVGGFSAGSLTFQNNALAYVITSQDANGVKGTTAINVTGTGILTLAGTHTYTGATTVASGTLALASGTVLGNTAVNVASASSAASLIVNGNASVGTPTSGAGSLTVGASTGIGTLTFSNTELATSTLTVNNAAANLAITLGSASTSDTAILNFNTGSSSVDQLITPGMLNVGSAGAVINLTALSGQKLRIGTYNLLSFASATNPTGLTLGTTPNGTVFYLTTTPTAVVLNVSNLSPGQLFWNSAVTVAGNTDVSSLGASAAAYNWSNATQTVNGVTFTGTNLTSGGGTAITFSGFSTNSAAYTSTSAPFSNLPAAYKSMLTGADFNAGATVTVTLNSLTAGHVYTTQLWVGDPRTAANTHTETITGNNTSILAFDATQAAGGLGQYSIGRFIANASTQSFTVSSSGGIVQINAMQIRDVTGVWSGAASANLNGTDVNFTGGNSFNTIATSSSPVTTLYFGDTDGFGNPISNSNLTIQAGGFSTGNMTFTNNSVGYTLNSQDANGISGATALNLAGTGGVTLTGAHTYSGATTLASGTLTLGSGAGATLGNTAVNVASTTTPAALVINGSSTIGSSAGSLTLGASSGVGTLTFANTESSTSTLTINNSAANTALTLGGASSGTAVLNINTGNASIDQIVTAGKLHVGAGGATINLAALGGSTLAVSGTPYTLISYGTSTPPIGLTLGTVSANSAALVYLTTTSTAVQLNVTNLPASAGQLNWGPAVTIAGTADVFTLGTSTYAYNWTGTSQTVNGVTFTGTASFTAAGANITLSGFTNNSANAYNSATAPFGSLPTAYLNTLIGGDYNGGAAATVTLNNLTAGHVYVTQFWVGDPRGGGEATRNEVLTANNIVTLAYDVSQATGGLGQYSLGGFMANGTTESFTITSNASTQINAIQVRDVTGIWSGAASGSLNASDGNFTGGNNYAVVSSLVNSLYFGDSDGFGNPVSHSSITIPAGGIAAGAMVFQNNSVNYTLTSSDATGIGGTTALSLAGTGSVTLAGAHTYSGATTVSSGTLILAAGASLGNTAVSVANSTTAGSLQINGNVTIGSASSGAGSVTIGGGTGVGTLTFLNSEPTTSTLTINNSSANSALTLGSASGALTAFLNFNTANSSVDQITTAGKLAVGAGGAVINLAALGGTTLQPGTYNLMGFGTSTVPTGFILGTTPAVSPYLFFLSASATAETLNVVAAQTSGLVKWNAPQNISGNADVFIVGSSSYAFNWQGTNQTVGGVTFTGSNSISGGGSNISFAATGGSVITNFTAFTTASAPYSNLPTAYQGILAGGDYTSVGSVITVTLNSLTSGHAYAAQLWVDDPRGTVTVNRTQTVTSGNGVTLNFNSNTAGALGQYVIGGFVANGTTQVVTVAGGTGGVAQINAIQVRDVTGAWSGAASGNLNSSDANFTGGNSFSTVSGLAVSTLYFGDTDGFGNPITRNSITVAAGGISTGTLTFVNNSVSYTFSSADANGISGATAVGLAGSGKVTFAGPNTYTGATTIAAGTLALGNGAALGNTAVTVAGSAAAALQINGNSTIGAAAGGTGTLTVAGSVGAGSLTFVNSESTPSTLTINNSAANTAIALGGSSGVSAVLNFNTGNSGVDQIVTAGKLSVGAGGAVLNLSALSGTTLPLGAYTLISFGASAAPAGISLGTAPAGNPALFYLTSTTTTEVLNVVAAPATAYWAGSQSSVWSTNLGGAGTTNWVTTPGAGTDSGVPGGGTNVFFTATSAGNLSTTLGQNLAINSLNVTGTGTSAAAGISIGGASTLTINATSANGITIAAGAGPVSITAPITVAGAQTWANSSSSGLTVSGGVTGAGNLTLQALSSGAITLSGAGSVNMTGAIINSGSGSGGTTITAPIGANVTSVTENSATSALILGGTNAYSGGTVVSAGTLSATAASALGSGNVVVNGGGTLNISAAGAGGAGQVQISGGVVNINAAGALGAGGALLTSGQLNVNASGLGTGTLAIAGGTISNTSGGAIVVGTNNAETWSGGFTFGGNNALTLGPGTVTLQTSPTITTNVPGGSVNTLAIGGVITGAFGLTKSGPGTLQFNGANNYTGTTTVSQGTLVLNSNSTADGTGYVLGDSNTGSNNVALILAAGINLTNAAMEANVANARTINVVASSHGTGSATIGVGGSGVDPLLNLTVNRATTIQGPLNQLFALITGPGAGAGNTSLTLDVNGGTFVWTNGSLSGTTPTANSFVGNVHFINSSASAGTLQMQNLAYASTAGNLAYQNLMIPNSSSVTVDPNVSWLISWGVQSIDALNGQGTISVLSAANNPAGAPVLTVGANNGSGSYGGIIQDNGATPFILGKTGTGTQTLTGANTFSGGTFILQGILQLGTQSGTTVGSLLAGSAVTLGNATTNSSGVLQLGDAANPVNQTLGGVSLAGTGSANAVVGGNSSPSILTINTSTTTSFAGALGGGGVNYNSLGLAVNGTGIVTLSGTDTYTGPTLIQNGTLQAGSNTAFQGTSAVTLGSGPSTPGTLDLNGYNVNVAGLTTGTTSGASGNLVGNSSTAANGTLIFSGGASTFGGTIQDSIAGGTQTVSLQVNSGTLTLTGINTYSGGTTVAGGTLRLQTGSIAPTTGVVVRDPGTLSVFGITPTSTTLTISTLALGSSGGAALTFELNGTPTAAPLTVSSSNGISLIGTSAINVTDLASLSVGEVPLIAYNGTQITSGLRVGSLPNARVIANIDYTMYSGGNGVIQLNVTKIDSPKWEGQVSGVNNGTWDINSTQNWQLIQQGVPTTYLQGDTVLFDDTATGTTTVNLVAAVAPSGVTFNNNSKSYSLSGSGGIGGATFVSITGGGVVTLATNNSYSGGTNLISGQLNINSGSAIGTGILNISAGTTISNTNAGNSVTLTTTNAETWGGSFTFGGNNPLNLGAGAVTLGQSLTLTLNGASPLTVGGVIGDGGSGYSLTVAGTGTLILTGASTYSGSVGTQINSGATLQLGAGGSAGSVAGNIVNGGSLVVNLSGNQTIDNIISGAGSVAYAGSGTMAVTGANTYAGATFINSGTVNAGAAETVGVSGPFGTGGAISFGGGILQFSTSNQFDYSPRFSTAANQAFNVDTNGQTVTFAGSIASAGGALTKLGAGTLILAGPNSYTGNTFINVGVLTAGAAESGGTGPFGHGGTIVFGGGTLQYSSSNQFDYSTRFSTAANQPISIDTNGQTVTLAGSLTSAGGTLAVSSSAPAGALIPIGLNTFSGGTTLISGQLNLNVGGGPSSSPLGVGALTILGGTIDNTSGGAVTLGTNNAENWNGSFAFGGSSPLNLGIGAVALGTNITVSVNGGSLAKALTIAGPIVSGQYGLTVAGTANGTLILSGVNNVNGVAINGGNLIVPAGSLTTTSMTLGNLAATNAVTLTGGSITINGTASFIIGNNAAASSAFTVNSGTVNINTSGNFLVANGIATTVTGTFMQTGGTVNWSPTNGAPSNNFLLGNNSAASFTVSGGLFTGSANSSGVCVGVRGNTLLTVSGGGVFSEASGYVSIGYGGAVTTTSNSSVTLGDGATFVGGSGITTGGSSGVLIAQMVGKDIYAGGTPGTATLSFNGGTLRASQANPTFISGLDFAYVQGAGGIIDDNGFTITIPQALSTGGGTDGGMVFMNSSASPAVTTLSGVSSYNGGTTILGGTTVALGVGNALGNGFVALNPTSGTATLNVGTFSQAATTLTLGGGAGSTAQVTGTGAVQLTGGGITFVGANNPNGAVISANVDLNGGPRTFTIGVTTASPIGLTISGIVEDIAHGATLNKAGPGALALTASNTYLGATTISAGTVQLSGGTTQSSPFTVGNGAALAVVNPTAPTSSAKLPSLTLGTTTSNTTVLNLAAASDWTTSSPTLLAITGALTANGGANTTTINVASPAFLNVGFYNLVGYASLAGTGFAAFQLGTLPASVVSASLTNSGSAIQLDVTAVQPFKWTGHTNGVWDVLATPNWQVAGSPATFQQNQTALFDDTATGTTSITLGVTVTPSAVMFNNTSKAYSISGGGSIAGATAVSITGGGVVALATNNTYTGGTSLSNGTLDINAGGTSSSNSAIGAGPLSISGGTIDNSSGTAVTLATNNAQNWNNNFAFGGSNPLNLGTGAVTLGQSLTVTLNGAGTLTVAGVIGGQSAGYGLTIAGTGRLTLTANNTYGGGTTINGGTLNISGDGSLGAASANVVLNGGTLQFNPAGGIALNASRNIVLGGGSIDTNNGTDTINGVISGASPSNSNLIKIGAGALILNNINSYAGATMVSGGSLVVSSSANLGSGPLNVSNPNTGFPATQTTLFLTNSAQTVGPLSGTIAQPGNGNTAGIFLSSGTTLTINQTTAGTFMGNISGGGNLVMSAASNSALQLTGNNTFSGSMTILGGTLQLNVRNQLPATTALSFAASAGSGTAPTLNLNNNDLQVASLSGGSGTSGLIQTGTGVGGVLTVVNSSGGSTTFGGGISGKGGLALGLNNTQGPNNTATLVLTGPNTFTGGVTINSGTLRADDWTFTNSDPVIVVPINPSNGAQIIKNNCGPTFTYTASGLPILGTFTLANSASASLDLAGSSQAIGSLAGGGLSGGNITLGNGGILQIIQSQSTIYAGIISGTGTVIVGSSAGGVLILANHSNFSGSTYADLIQIAVSQALPINNNVIFTSSPNDGLDLNGRSQTVSTISGGGAGNDNGKGTILDSQGTGSILTITFNPNNPLGGPVTDNFSGSIVNDVSVVVDAAVVGASQTLTLSGTNNSTGSLTVGNATSPSSAGAHSGAGNSVVISGSSSFAALAIGNTYAGNIINSVTVSAVTGNLMVGGISIGDSAAGSAGANTLTVGGTVTSTGDVNIGGTSPFGVNTLTVLKGGTLAGSGNDVSIVVSNFSGGSGTLNANGNIGTTANPVGTLLVRTGGLLAGGGTITTKGIGTAITISGGTIRGGVDSSNSYGTLTIAPAGGTSAANSLVLGTNGQSGMGQATTLLGEVQRSGIDTVNASLIQLTGINKSLNISTSAGGVLNINLNDPTASLLPGERYVINLVQTSAIGGTIRLNGRIQSANTVIDSGNSIGTGSGNSGIADLYITGNNGFVNNVTGWSLGVNSAGNGLQLSVNSVVPEPAHVMLLCAGGLLAGFAVERRRRRLKRAQSIA